MYRFIFSGSQSLYLSGFNRRVLTWPATLFAVFSGGFCLRRTGG